MINPGRTPRLAAPCTGVAFSAFSAVEFVFSPIFRRCGVGVFDLNIYS
ncbi:MAG: hypothetical protein J5968_01125 [Oscillospiraceae bacterium]|nr:hypothetical protein [Oscillospiraceae bacterium]